MFTTDNRRTMQTETKTTSNFGQGMTPLRFDYKDEMYLAQKVRSQYTTPLKASGKGTN